MNDIYESAVAIIFVLAREDASYSLPGVNDKSRKKQPMAKVSCMELASGLSRLPVILAKSKWATRGWTYQEAVLSRRYIFFTDHQGYFVCKCSSYYKAVKSTLGEQVFRKGLASLRTDIFDTYIESPGYKEKAYGISSIIFSIIKVDIFRITQIILTHSKEF
jgi:hypothetical protein